MSSKFLNRLKSKTAFLLLVFLIALFFLFFYSNFLNTQYLRFSDSAKYAEIARNIISDEGFVAKFTFFSDTIFKQSKGDIFSARSVPILMPYSIVFAFSFFGISDFSVIITSGIFYLALVFATYFLGKKIFGNIVGFLSALAIATNPNFLDYATSGASEILFSFLAILTAYLALLRKKWANIAFFLGLISLYLTRPQGFLFIGIILFMWLTLNFSLRRAIISIIAFVFGAYVFDRKVLYPLSWKTNVYPIFTRGLQALFQYSSNFAVSDALRGGVAKNVGTASLVKKVFYNLYNFYKLLPQIASPYMWGLFIIGLFVWGKDRIKRLFKLTTILLVAGNFLLVALTIPFYRYIHPVIPFVYIISAATLVKLVQKISIKKYTAAISTTLIFIFIVGQTLGMIFLDSRFMAARTNKGEPPVYVQLSYILKDNTDKEDVVVTNLDTWGTWYGERKTVWFPLKPDQLIPPEGQSDPFDAIYLTSYLMDDENYYMGDEWRQVFYNPESPEDKFIAENFELKGIYKVSAEETYEKQDARAVLLVRKED